jgi:O-antigen ligase
MNRPAPRRSSSGAPRLEEAPLFGSAFEALAFTLLCAVALAAPHELSGFWPASRDYWPQSLGLIVGIVACLMLALSGEEAQHSRPPLSPLGACLLGFAAWSALSIATAAYQHDALLELSRLAAALVWFGVARRLLWHPVAQVERQRLAILALAATLGALWVCGLAAWGFVQGRTRQPSTFYNANLFANYAAMGLPLAASTWLLWRRSLPGLVAGVLGLGAIGVCGVGLLVSYSKGGLASGALGLMAFAFWAWKARKKSVASTWHAQKRVLAPVLVCVVVGASLLFAATVLPRLRSAGGSESHSTQFRAYTWRGTLAMANARPLLGHGAGSFPSAFPRYAQAGYTRSAHQSWLQIAAETGWPSLLLLLGALGLGLRRLGQYRKEASRPHRALAGAGAGAALVALFVHGCTDSGWGILSIAILTALCLALLDAPPEDFFSTEQREEQREERRPLAIRWLLPMLPLALAASYGLKSQAAEQARAESRALMRNGANASALAKAREATELSPLDARMWANQAFLREASGDKEGAAVDHGQARTLQPTRASHALNTARLFAERGDNSKARSFFDQSVALDPQDTSLRLERARFLQKTGDSRGAQADFERVVALADEPYGRYPATPEVVNLDFNRARLALAQQARLNGDAARARTLALRGLEDIKKARDYRAANPDLFRALREGVEGPPLPEESELSQQEQQFQALAR